MSWFSERVGNLVRDVQRQAATVGTGIGQRSADELAADLESQARRVSGPQSAVELLTKWVERADSNQGSFSLGACGEGGHGLAEPLSFHQGLLRSHAFELFLEACARIHSLRVELHKSRDDDQEEARLCLAMRAAAERVLLPGANVLWPSLLEVLLASSGFDDGGGGGLPHTESKCRSWAQRALALVKRQWQSEALPAALRCLDRKLLDLMAKQPKESNAETQSPLLRSSATGKRMSKSGIRAAMANDKLRKHTSDAAKLRAKTELLCDACARLEAAQSMGEAVMPEVERLLDDANDILADLDSAAKLQAEEQDSLRTSLREITNGLEDQISQFQETLLSFNDKRGPLQDKRALLMRQLEETNMQIVQIDEATAAYEKKARGLAEKLRNTTNHYEDKIAKSLQQQQQYANEKTRAILCKECAHIVSDIVNNEEERRGLEVAAQLRRRRTELRGACAAYVSEERMRIETASECLDSFDSASDQPHAHHVDVNDEGAPVKLGTSEGARHRYYCTRHMGTSVTSSPDGFCGPHDGPQCPSCKRFQAEQDRDDAEHEQRRACIAIRDAWHSAHGVLRRALPLLVNNVNLPAATEAAQSTHGAETASTRTEDALVFFGSIPSSDRVCVDCGSQEADWASVSHGTYLCMDCAGRHRGLGVHLSFVRSTTMDLWNNEQLRRMQIGGTQQFHEFLKLYPRLCTPPRTMAELSTRYRSRAVAHYRRLLEVRCDGGDGTEIRAPSPDEGHHPIDENAQSNLGTPPSWFGEHREIDAIQDADHSASSFEQQHAMLESAFQRHRHRLQRLPLSPADTSFHDRLPELKPARCLVRRDCSDTAPDAGLTKSSCDDPTTFQGSSRTLKTDLEPPDVSQSDGMGHCALQDEPVVEVQTLAQIPQEVAVDALGDAACSFPGDSGPLSDQTTAPLVTAQGTAAVDHVGSEPTEHPDCIAQQGELADSAVHLSPKDDHPGETSYEGAEAVFG